MFCRTEIPVPGIRVAAVLASTLDGRLAHPGIPVLGSDADRRQLEGLRAQADVLLYGAGTARADSRRLIEFCYPEIARPVRLRLGRPVPPIVVLSRNITFDFTGPFWSTPTPKLLLHARPAGSAATFQVPGDVTYQPIPFTGDPGQPAEVDEADMALVLIRLSQWVAEAAPRPDGQLVDPGTDRPLRVLCEGGGALVAALLRAELLDELFLTLTGWVAGSDKDTPLTIGGITGPQHLTLQGAHVSTTTSEVFLRYRRGGREPWPITEER
jgi:riboflavin biosynthesis pyrimidine reductase